MNIPEYKLINGYKHIRYDHDVCQEDEVMVRSNHFYHWMNKRRSVREFDNRQIPKAVIDDLIRAASTAPSGAHKQPWVFCAIGNPGLKSEIRKAAEIEEKQSYDHRMTERWKKALAPLATDMHKPFLETAPWLIIAFKVIYDFDESGNKVNNYYVNESIGIACGMLITAIHHAGLVTLTHTPSPMNFLAKILGRPSNERAFLLLPIGYPKQPVFVPALDRKNLEDVAVFYE